MSSPEASREASAVKFVLGALGALFSAAPRIPVKRATAKQLTPLVQLTRNHTLDFVLITFDLLLFLGPRPPPGLNSRHRHCTASALPSAGWRHPPKRLTQTYSRVCLF